jgi:uncharacterized protein (TIRG00374 family)
MTAQPPSSPSVSPAQNTSQDWKRILPGLIVSLVCLAAVLYIAQPARLLEALQLADFRLVALGFVVSLGWILFRTLVWRTILQEKATLGQVFWTVNIGYLLNNLLPLRLGELARSFLLSRQARIEFFEVLSTIVIERILDLAYAAGLLLVTLSFIVGGGAGWARPAAISTGVIVLAGLIVLYLVARFRQWFISLYHKIGARWPIVLRIGGDRVEAIFNGLEALRDGRRFLTVLLWMTCNWGVAVVQYYTLLLAFVPNAPPLWGAFALAVAAFGIAAPSSPGAVGVFEAAVVAGLGVLGVDPARALAFALTAHLINFLNTGILGAVGLAVTGQSLSDLYSSLRRLPQNSPPA